MKYLVSILLLVASCFGQQHQIIAPVRTPSNIAGAATNAANATLTANSIMVYHGGPVMLGTPNIYYILYGNWPNGSIEQLVLENLGKSLGGSPLFQINSTYTDGNGVPISGNLQFQHSTVDSYSVGSSLTDSLNGGSSNIHTLIASHLGSDFPIDPNGIYVVLSSPDVASSLDSAKFGQTYCGYHWFFTYNGVSIKYAFIGNPYLYYQTGCMAQLVGPNGANGSDAMANVVTHELAETVTDPEGTGWYADSTGQENADVCVWTFPPTFLAPNGSLANMILGGLYYLNQRNYVNAKGGGCSLLNDSDTWPTLYIISPLQNTIYQCDSTNYFSFDWSTSGFDSNGKPLPANELYGGLSTFGSNATHTSGFGEGWLLYSPSGSRFLVPCTPVINGTTYYAQGGSFTARTFDYPNSVSVSFTVKQYVPTPPMVVVSPNTATVHLRGTQQFTANIAVVWSVNGPGSISSTGLYKAPGGKGAIKNSSTAIVIATDASNSSNTGTATVSILP